MLKIPILDTSINVMKIKLFMLSLIFSQLPLNNSFAATSASATTTVTIIVAITITKISDLNFGNGIQGDSAKTILASNASAANFQVTGNANAAYTITLPSSATMTTGTGTNPNQQIVVNNFISTPSAGANGLLNNSGTQTLRVGATRSGLLASQVPGAYSTAFTINVIY